MNLAGLPGGPAPVGGQFSTLCKRPNAHSDSIWSVAWKRQPPATKHGAATDLIVTGGVDDTVKVWTWLGDKLEEKFKLEGHQLGVISVDIDETGTMAASSSLDSHIKLWDLETGKQLKDIDAGAIDAWSVKFTTDSKFLITGSHNNQVNIFECESGRKTTNLTTSGKFNLSLAVSAKTKYVGTGTMNGYVNVFDVETGKTVVTLEAHTMPIRGVCFSPDNQLLATACDDNTIKIIDILAPTTPVATLSGHQSWVLSVDWSADNTRLVSGSSDRSVMVWNSASRKSEATFVEHGDQVWGVKYNPPGNKIVSVSDDKAIHVYEVPPLG